MTFLAGSDSVAAAARYYPAFLDLRGRAVVVVGGGEIATRKVLGLLPCGTAPLTVIAPSVAQAVSEAATAGHLRWVARPYQSGDVAGAALVFAATADRAVNATVAAEARERGVPVLAVDDVPNCDFIAPALVERGGLSLAISTHGRSPAMARRAREQLDRLVPAHWGDLLDVAATVRLRLRAASRTASPDRWQAGLDGEVERLTAAGRLAAAADLLEQRLGRAAA